MTAQDLKRKGDETEHPHCLVRTVARALEAEPGLEALTLDRKQRSIAVATLGKPADPQASARLATKVRAMDAAPDRSRCGLLEGSFTCETCETPLTEREQAVVEVKRAPDTTTVARLTCPTAPRFYQWRHFPLPRVKPRESPLPEEVDENEWKPQLAAAVACGLFALAGALLPGGAWKYAAFATAYLAGGWFVAEDVWVCLKKRVLDVHFLMLAVAAGSASIGAWGEGATLLFLFSLSGALEHFALGRTHREIRSLFKTAPKVATLLDAQGNQTDVPVEELRPGQRLLIKPGAQFPVDAEVVGGQTASDESNLTGESAPVEKGAGDTVFAGTMNLWGAVEAIVLRPAHLSALQKIIQLIRQAQQLKAPSQRFTDRFGTGYTYTILSLSAVMFFVWWLGFGLEPFASAGGSKSAFYRTMTLLVVASPCALVLSIPSAILAAIAWGARRGVLFRGGAAVEKLAEVQVVALDKTGTLTTGDLAVEKVESFPPGREREVAQLAYSLERMSHHPLARAITRHGKKQGLQAVEVARLDSLTGLGLRATVNGADCVLGRRELIARAAPTGVLAAVPPSGVGVSEVWLARGDLIGRVLLRDDVRPQARELLGELRREGLRTLVLTGDRRATADDLKARLELEDVRAELKPEEKVSIIHDLTREGRRVAMVGDGVNDAPSLAAAHVGVAMGARGSDAPR
jgi:Cd2+/Zn2+-exporting ATPase